MTSFGRVVQGPAPIRGLASAGMGVLALLLFGPASGAPNRRPPGTSKRSKGGCAK
jgi:hypothetical protein